MNVLDAIEKKLRDALHPTHLEVIDLRGGDHIQVIAVADLFEGKSIIEKHKIIYDVLAYEMKSNIIHALTLKIYSPGEWQNIKGGFNKEVGHDI